MCVTANKVGLLEEDIYNPLGKTSNYENGMGTTKRDGRRAREREREKKKEG